MSLKLKIWRKFQSWVHPYVNVGKGSKVSFWANGTHHCDLEGGNIIPEYCSFADKTFLGKGTTLGTNNYFGGKVKIGRYCQIGRDVAFHPTNHPTEFLTTYINQQLFSGELKKLKQEKPITIGNDVWIGHGVIVLAGVKVGDGAILAAGAIVTKDVDPYTIVAGNPAKPLRKRFSDGIIEELLELSWWNLSDEDIQKYKPLFFQNLTGLDSIQTSNK